MQFTTNQVFSIANRLIIIVKVLWDYFHHERVACHSVHRNDIHTYWSRFKVRKEEKKYNDFYFTARNRIIRNNSLEAFERLIRLADTWWSNTPAVFQRRVGIGLNPTWWFPEALGTAVTFRGQIRFSISKGIVFFLPCPRHINVFDKQNA